MTNHHLVAWSMVILLGSAAAVPAQPRLGPPVDKEIVLETRYQFYVRGYRRPALFDPAAYRPAARQPTESPEAIVMRLLSARARGELDAYLELLSDGARQRFLDTMKELGRSAPEQASAWQEQWRGLHVELTHQVYVGLARLVRYRAFDPASGEDRDAGEFLLRIGKNGLWSIDEPTGEEAVVVRQWRFEGREKILKAGAASGAP